MIDSDSSKLKYCSFNTIPKENVEIIEGYLSIADSASLFSTSKYFYEYHFSADENKKKNEPYKLMSRYFCSFKDFNFKKMEECFLFRYDNNIFFPEYDTPGKRLVATISNRQTDLAKLLIHSKAEINGLEGNSPLFEACKIGNLKLIEMLILKGADLEALSSKGKTPLQIAARLHNADVLQFLLLHGAKIPFDEEEKNFLNDVIYGAIFYPFIPPLPNEILEKFFLEVLPEDSISEYDLSNEIDVIKFIDFGKKLFLKDTKYYISLLNIFISKSLKNNSPTLDIIKILMESFKDSRGFEIKNNTIESTLNSLYEGYFTKKNKYVLKERLYPTIEQMFEISNYLIIKKLEIDFQDLNKRWIHLGQCFAWAICFSIEDIVQDILMLTKIDGFNIGNVIISQGNRVIHRAVDFERIDLVDELIQLGADVNVPDQNDCLPIQMAVLKNNFKLVQVLVEKGGANPKKKLCHVWGRMSAIEIAKKNSYRDILDYFQNGPKDKKEPEPE